MARKVFENIDLKRHIFAFGYPEHRKFTKELKEHLHVDSESFGTFYEQHSNDRDIVGFILDEFTETEILSYMHYLNRCRCCTRHSHSKPNVQLVNGNVTQARMTCDQDCNCKCRYYARFMHRAYVYYQDN